MHDVEVERTTDLVIIRTATEIKGGGGCRNRDGNTGDSMDGCRLHEGSPSADGQNNEAHNHSLSKVLTGPSSQLSGCKVNTIPFGDGRRYRDIEKNRQREGHSPHGNCRGRDRSGHGLRAAGERGRVAHVAAIGTTDSEGRRGTSLKQANCRSQSRVTCGVRIALIFSGAFPMLCVDELTSLPVPSIWLLCSRIRAHAPGCHASIASIASSPIHSITHRCLCFDPLPIRFPLLPFCLISRAPMLKTPGSPTPIASTSQTTACTMPRQSSPHWEPLTVGDVECWV